MTYTIACRACAQAGRYFRSTPRIVGEHSVAMHGGHWDPSFEAIEDETKPKAKAAEEADAAQETLFGEGS